MTATDDALRRALGQLSGRERAAVRHHSEQAAAKWAPLLPHLAEVWHAFAALAAEVDQNATARAAAEHTRRPTVRHARRQRI